MNNFIYLDNAGSTKPCVEACEIANFVNENDYANASALNSYGLSAEKIIKNAQTIIANGLNVTKDEIIFTSGATESNNMAIFGACYRNQRQGKHIISQMSEHPSVLKVIKQLEDDGFNVTYLPLNESGNINIEDLKSAITDETVLVSIMHVNNETGSMFDINEIGQVIKGVNPNTMYHIDGVQSFGKYDVDLKKAKADFYSFSGHKVHSIKGVGGLYIKKGTKINPLIYGGGQQEGLRSGTLNTSGIASLGKAFEVAKENRAENLEKVQSFKNELLTLVNNETILLNGTTDVEFSSPYIVNLAFVGLRSEVILHELGSKGIYVSTGSACSSKKGNAMLKYYKGFSEERVVGSLRFSFSRFTTLEDVKITIEEVNKAVEKLKMFVRR